MIRRFFVNLIFKCFLLLLVIVIFYPQFQQLTAQLNFSLMELGAPAGIELNLKELILNPGKAESDLLNELLNSINNF